MSDLRLRSLRCLLALALVIHACTDDTSRDVSSSTTPPAPLEDASGTADMGAAQDAAPTLGDATPAVDASGADAATDLLSRSAEEPASETCPTGGVRVESGADRDGNGQLSDDEVDESLTTLTCHAPCETGTIYDPLDVACAPYDAHDVSLSRVTGHFLVDPERIRRWGRSEAPIEGLGAIAAVEAGEMFACALLEEGSLRCWGDNHFGQLGLGDSEQSPRRVDAPVVPTNLPGERIEQVSTGSRHVCAVTQSGDTYCWGFNATRQLGRLPTATTSEKSGTLSESRISRGPRARSPWASIIRVP